LSCLRTTYVGRLQVEKEQKTFHASTTRLSLLLTHLLTLTLAASIFVNLF